MYNILYMMDACDKKMKQSVGKQCPPQYEGSFIGTYIFVYHTYTLY